MGVVCAAQEKREKEGASLPPGAEGEVEETSRAVRNTCWQNFLSGLLKHDARRRLTEGTWPPWNQKRERERARITACGGVALSVGDQSMDATRGAVPSESG